VCDVRAEMGLGGYLPGFPSTATWSSRHKPGLTSRLDGEEGHRLGVRCLASALVVTSSINPKQRSEAIILIRTRNE
jgi:hypothetical protein